MIEWEDVDPSEFFDDDGGMEDEDGCGVPDVAIDTEERTLSVCNIEDHTKVAYVTVYTEEEEDQEAVGAAAARVIGADGMELTAGSTVDNRGRTSKCITFIVLCPPRVFCHLCYLQVVNGGDIQDLTSLRIESDVSPWRVHPQPEDEHSFRIGFPLGARMDGIGLPSNSAYLCTQGEGGHLTHFFSGNQHAIDFRCPVGTELLAVADGIVAEANDQNTLAGIAVTNLFEWNSILLEVETTTTSDKKDDPSDGGGPLFVEYVHISKSLVKKGDVVKQRQVIGYSGSVGFSPEPHLHFSAFRSKDPEAPTVRVQMESDDENGSPFVPRAGKWYNEKGEVEGVCIT